MGKFFNGWELWEKMVFVLGCAIVVVVLLGCLKLTYTHWRLRKLGVIAEKQRQEQALRRELSAKRRPPGTRKEGEVPFGVRAIESGIEVEGVWISRNNSPEPTSSREGSKPSSIFEIAHNTSHEIDIEKQSPNHRTGHSLRPSETDPNGGNVSTNTLLAEKMPRPATNKQPSRDPSPEPSLTMPSNLPQYPPVSCSLVNNTSIGLRSSQATSSLEGLEAIHQASTSYYTPDNGYGHSDDSESSQQSSGEGVGGESIYASAPMLLNSTSDKEKHQSVDAVLLNERRISQAAETGQLTPRTRRPKTASGDWTGAAAADPALRSLQEARLTNRSRSASPARSGIESLPPTIRTLSIPNVTPFTEFIQTAPPSPGHSSVFSVASENNELKPTPTDTLTAGPLTSSTSAPLFPARKVEDDDLQPRSPSCERQSCRQSQVLRGHGTGFEILQPGSLNPRLPGENSTERQRAAPPVSLKNFTRVRSSSLNSAGSGRRLQKKRRESVDSSTSASSGRKSRNSTIQQS